MNTFDPDTVEQWAPWVIQYDEFATTEQAAECIGVSIGTLARWRKKGTGPRFIRFGFQGIGYRWHELVQHASSENVAKMLGRLTGCGAGLMKK